MPRILIAVTSSDEKMYANGDRTGLFLSEALHPFNVFHAQKFDVDFVSETGKFHIDEHSILDQFLSPKELEDYKEQSDAFYTHLNQLRKASDVDGSLYDIIFFAGGHGAVFDFPTAKGLHKLAQDVYAKGGVVAAVCHGPAVLAGLKAPGSDELLAKGKIITGFTQNGEAQLGVAEIMDNLKVYSIERLAPMIGASYSMPASEWVDHSVADGRLVTGVNPASALSCAQKAIEALNA